MSIAKPQIIDLHSHVLPPEYVSTLAPRGIEPPGVSWPPWSPELALEMAETTGIEKTVLSLSAPGVFFGEEQLALHLARLSNEYCAGVVRDFSPHFGSFAFLPLPFVDGALEELEYALDTLELDGVVLLSNTAGKYVGDPQFDALFAELNRRKVFVLVHPTSPTPEKISDLKLPAYALEFPFDTTRAVASLLLSGVFDRYPDIRFQFTHAGGTIPYLLQRLEYTRTRSAETFPELRRGTPNGVAATLRENVFYDTALSYGKATLSALGQFPGYDRVVFGSDFPHAPARYTAETVEALRTYFEQDDAAYAAIERENALNLLKVEVRR